MHQIRRLAALTLSALLGAAPAFAQTEPDAPLANSVDATGTFSVNPRLESDPDLHAEAKVGPSRTDINSEGNGSQSGDGVAPTPNTAPIEASATTR